MATTSIYGASMGANSKPIPEQPIDAPTSPQAAVGGGRAHAPFTQRQNESDVAYAAFLLWCMQTPDSRSNRLLARSMGTAESNIRHWKIRNSLETRMFHSDQTIESRLSVSMENS